jgi:hypothetical protein
LGPGDINRSREIGSPEKMKRVTITKVGNELNERKNQPRVAFVEKDTAAQA